MGGLRPWLLQRLTALFMLVFIVFLVAHFLLEPPHSHAEWRAWLLSPRIGIAATVFMACLLLHTWVGVRDVVLDYVRPPGLRLGTLAVLGLGLLSMAAWSARILLFTAS